jgi:MFS family permease
VAAHATAAPRPARRRARDLAAVVAGNGLEFYDFIAYAFFALEISRAFFPARTPGTSLLLALATFGAGFLMRPLGALVLGRLADRGRWSPRSSDSPR